VSKVFFLLNARDTTSHTFDGAILEGWNLAQEANFTALGAIGCVSIVSRYPGLESTSQDPTISNAQRDTIAVPVFEVSDIDYQAFTAFFEENPHSPLVIWIGQDEKMYYEYWYSAGGIVLAVIMCVLNAAAIFSTTLSLASFVMFRCSLNIAMVCVVLHLIASVSTFLFLPTETSRTDSLLYYSQFQLGSCGLSCLFPPRVAVFPSY